MANKITHTSCQSGHVESCHSGAFKRVNYFHGMLLTEQDFVDEQTYIREKLKLHNRLYGAGVAWGLCLFKDCIKVGSGTDIRKITRIFIKAGLAIDCAGNEIVVCEDYLVPLDEKIEELRRLGQLTKDSECQPPKCKGPRLYVGIRYCECKSDPAEQYTSECADDRLRPQYSRVREGFNVQLFTQDELPCCESHHDKDSPCGCAHTCSECEGLHLCTEAEQLIILGYIENYAAEADDHKHEKLDHKDAKLTPHEDCPTTPGCGSGKGMRDPRWEAQKQKILRAVFDEAKWIDVASLIGRQKAEVDDWLKEKGLSRGDIYPAGKIPDVRRFVARANDAQHWAPPGSVIDIITDTDDKCVIFFLINPLANQ